LRFVDSLRCAHDSRRRRGCRSARRPGAQASVVGL